MLQPFLDRSVAAHSSSYRFVAVYKIQLPCFGTFREANERLTSGIEPRFTCDHALNEQKARHERAPI